MLDLFQDLSDVVLYSVLMDVMMMRPEVLRWSYRYVASCGIFYLLSYCLAANLGVAEAALARMHLSSARVAALAGCSSARE
jgi:hypothetical protein